MNRTKKLLFTLLSLVFVICMFSVTASAATYKYNNQNLEIKTEGEWQYIVLTAAALTEDDKSVNIKAGDVYITKYTGTAASVVIPEKLGGGSVAFIGAQSFKGNTAVQTVTVSNSVKYICVESFMDCTGLQQVLINANVWTINNSAFKNCTALKSVTFHKNIKLKNIQTSAFENCKSLNNFKIPETVTTINNCAFWNCDSLKEIKIPDSVTFYGKAVFFSCDSLENVVVGDGVAALECRDYSVSENWGKENNRNGAFEGCISLKQITIGKGVETIGQDAFAGCGLLEIVIPDNVKTMSHGVFMNCAKLKKVVIGNGVTSIGNSAFENNKSLIDVRIGSAVRSFGEIAFMNCDALQEITIPSNVTSLGSAIFFSCGNLQKVVIGNGVTSLSARGYSVPENWGVENNRMGAFEGCVKLDEIVIGSAVSSIGIDCFAGTAFESVSIPDNVKILDQGVFMNCKKLKSISIGNGVTTIGYSAFRNDTVLENVDLGLGVITIGDIAFMDCESLKEITIPSNVTTLGTAAFFSCENLQNVVIGNGVTAIKTRGYSIPENWGIENNRMGTFEGCKNLTSVTLGSGLISIDTDTFAGTQITELTVPAKVSELIEGAFAGAKKLKDIYFTGNWPVKTGGKLFNNIADGYTIHYIKNKVGYDDLTYNKAEFTPITVTFDNNNDDVFAVITEEQIMAPVGGYVIEPIIPAASGYRFVGWYKDSKCTNAWNFKTDKVTKNTTLYAKWDDVTKVKPVRPEELVSDAVTGKTIDLKWQAVDGATSYNVYVDGKKVNAKPVTENMYTVTGLKADTTYEIEVTAVNSKGESPKSLILAKRTSEVKFSLGDVDDDGKITAADARLALRISVNLEKPTEDQKMAADIDGNGSVTAADARIILRISVNLEKIESYIK